MSHLGIHTYLVCQQTVFFLTNLLFHTRLMCLKWPLRQKLLSSLCLLIEQECPLFSLFQRLYAYQERQSGLLQQMSPTLKWLLAGSFAINKWVFLLLPAADAGAAVAVGATSLSRTRRLCCHRLYSRDLPQQHCRCRISCPWPLCAMYVPCFFLWQWRQAAWRRRRGSKVGSSQPGLAGWQAMQAIGREKGNIFPSQPTLPNDQITSELGVIYVPIPERAAASMATHDKRKSLAVAAARRGGRGGGVVRRGRRQARRGWRRGPRDVKAIEKILPSSSSFRSYCSFPRFTQNPMCILAFYFI